MADTLPAAIAQPYPMRSRIRRSLHELALRSTVLRWRFGIPPGDRLLLVPQNLRTVDASFVTELEYGCLGLAGAVANYSGGPPFDIPAPNDAWRKELHGFAWLRHMRAAGTPEVRQLGEDWIAAWLKSYGVESGDPWQPEVAARRLISLLQNADFLLTGAPSRFHDSYVRAANGHLRYLAKSYASVPDGNRKLLMLTGIMYGGLCIADQERFLDDFQPVFCDELDRQILPDGSALTRDATAIVEITLDLLPLRRCFTARKLKAPEHLPAALRRAIPFLAHMRLGDGMLTRFNGVSATWPDRLATVLAYLDVQNPPLEEAPLSGYARLERGSTITIMDVGVPPPYELSTHAHAGCLSFEMSSGTAPIVVNCGAPGPADTDWGPLGRGTAAHSALVLNDTSSSALLRDADDEKRLGGVPIEGPERVERKIDEKNDGSIAVSAWHDGYMGRFGIRHDRTLQLRARGDALEGTDKLTGGGGVFTGRSHETLPFAIRFHLHPRTRVRRGSRDDTVEIRLVNGETWEFTALDTAVNLEESVFLAELSGPLQAVQLVLRGSVAGTAEVNWRIRKLESPDDRRAEVREMLSVVGDESEQDEPIAESDFKETAQKQSNADTGANADEVEN